MRGDSLAYDDRGNICGGRCRETVSQVAVNFKFRRLWGRGKCSARGQARLFTALVILTLLVGCQLPFWGKGKVGWGEGALRQQLLCRFSSLPLRCLRLASKPSLHLPRGPRVAGARNNFPARARSRPRRCPPSSTPARCRQTRRQSTAPRTLGNLKRASPTTRISPSP